MVCLITHRVVRSFNHLFISSSFFRFSFLLAFILFFFYSFTPSLINSLTRSFIYSFLFVKSFTIFNFLSLPFSHNIKHLGFFSRSRDQRLPITKSQAEHCNGLCFNRVHQTRYKSPIRSLQEKDRCTSSEDAFRSNKVPFWKMMGRKS